MIRPALFALLVAPLPLAGQTAMNPSQRAESLWLSGRPWHAAETLLDAAARSPRQDPAFIVQGARAELQARRYDRTRSLLIGQPWLQDYGHGQALALLGEAEWRLGQFGFAAAHFVAARERAGNQGAAAALLAVHAALAFEAALLPDSAARYYAAARNGTLGSIDAWLRLRAARVQRDTQVAWRLLAGVPPTVGREAAAARAAALLLAGDSNAARNAFHEAGKSLVAARLALATGDSAAARSELYQLFARAPQSDDAAAGVPLAHGALPPRVSSERVALARVVRGHGDPDEARRLVSHALADGDSSGETLVLAGELFSAAGRYVDAAAAYQAAARDTASSALAVYRRGRVLVRLGDPGAPEALVAFADKYPADTAAPTALYLVGDYLMDHGDSSGGQRWLGELLRRYPADSRASLARFRLAAIALHAGVPDSAVRLYSAEIGVGGVQRSAARYWTGRIAEQRGDSAAADSLWRLLAREDSLGYYGLRARTVAGLPLLRISPDSARSTAAADSGLSRIDTLLLAGLDTEADLEVRVLSGRAFPALDDLLAWSTGLSARGWGSVGVRLGWTAAQRAGNDARVLRAIFPWPRRGAVEAEAREFGVDPFLFAGLVRQESTFDLEALSRAGARGLAQLMPVTAAQAARGLDVTFYPEWLTVPDLNLHLGASHLAMLLRRYRGRVEVAIAAYNAGPVPVDRWITRPGAEDSDQFIEQIPYPETRAYVRSVLRNRAIYRALYGSASN
ncbi:MAG TPA: transglycosylase SLT domain-containing protein [Gemmatimonadales bacterium]|nr:transglycosylase SLT domain-containing protein [Gemmatimonadales bacterium]